jgi:hypothetical protein
VPGRSACREGRRAGTVCVPGRSAVGHGRRSHRIKPDASDGMVYCSITIREFTQHTKSKVVVRIWRETIISRQINEKQATTYRELTSHHEKSVC